ncbi:MAG TPA: hypothetical protein VHV55_21065 [Pirellulales bacterium]|jgi:hypothetical protein|nr:hypothetical protein [Pirellulales bacterium]
MSIDPNSPYQPPLAGAGAAPPNRSRRIWLGLGIGCGVLILLCCGGFVGVSWWGTAKLKQSTSDDPVVIRGIATEIAEIPLPASFKPKYSLNMTVPFTPMKLKGVLYSSNQNGVGLFMMGEFNAEMSEAERQKFLQQMRASVQNNANEKLDVLESKTVTLKMRGKDASFKFAKAQNQDTKALVWQIVGTFQGKGGPAMIMMIVPYEQFTEDQLKKMFEQAK